MPENTLSPDALAFICEFVRSKSAIELDENKQYLIESRLHPIAQSRGFGSTSELLRMLQRSRQADLEYEVVEAMTTNETSFFRDIHPFETLRADILPLFMQQRERNRSLNIWSAACSTGQELYSIAMMIKEDFPELLQWNLDLIGTDLSEEVLEKARRANYLQVEVNRGLKAIMLAKYFKKDGMQWQLSESIRDMAKFRQMNLIESWPYMPKMDIVFLRNVLIYFSPETKKVILKKIRQSMAPDGLLFLGTAETPTNLDNGFEPVTGKSCVYYRLKG